MNIIPALDFIPSSNLTLGHFFLLNLCWRAAVEEEEDKMHQSMFLLLAELVKDDVQEDVEKTS